MESKLRWYVKYEPEYKGYGVWLGDFRHGWYEQKHTAIGVMDELNKNDFGTE